MEKYAITDWGWLGDALGGLFFAGTIGFVLYVWAASLGPFPGSVWSALVYYAFLVLLVVALVFLCLRGFTWRWAEIDKSGMVIHDGFYAVFWKKRAVPKSSIRTVERYEDFRRGFPVSKYVSGIRIWLNDGTQIILTERVGRGHFQREVSDFTRILEMDAAG
jgi:hypothetical protein